MPKFTFEIVDCPECTAPAEVVDRFVFESTNGPIEHGYRALRPTAPLHGACEAVHTIRQA